MLFYNFFNTQIGSKLKITLKNTTIVEGILESVDEFLNLKLQDATMGEINYMKLTIRGSSVRDIIFESGVDNIDKLHDATRYRFLVDKMNNQ